MKPAKIVAIGLILSLFWVIVSSYILVFLNNISEGLPDVDEQAYWYSFFFSCIWAPIWEEMMYRWAPIQIALKTDERKYLLPAIIIASASFGWGHGDCQEGVFIQGVLGLIFSGVYVYTRKIWCSMAVHSIYNSILFFLPALTTS